MRSHSFIGPLALLSPATTFAASIFLPRDVSPAEASSLPTGLTYSGCFVDSVSARSLNSARTYDNSGLTAASCVAFCSSQGYSVAGTEYSAECYCGSTLPAEAGDASSCNMPCSGDSTQACGGPDRLSVYAQGGDAFEPCGTNPGVGGFVSTGCVADSQAQRTLPNFTPVDGEMTVAKCVSACQAGGYSYAGTEYAGECWCGSEAPASNLLGQSGCDMPCSGNHSEFCGGSDRLNLYSAPPTCAPTFSSYGMMVNGGFESGFTGFTPNIVSGTFDIGLDTTHEHEGCNAAHVAPTSDPSSGNRQLQISQTISGLTSGSSYTFTGFQGRMSATKDYPSPVIGVSIGSQVLGQVTACHGGGGSDEGECDISAPDGAYYTQHVIPFTYGGDSESADLTFTITFTDVTAEGNPDLLFDGFKLVEN